MGEANAESTRIDSSQPTSTTSSFSQMSTILPSQAAADQDAPPKKKLKVKMRFGKVRNP